MYNAKTVSVVMPAYNEAKGIASVVRAFRQRSGSRPGDRRRQQQQRRYR